MFELTDRDFRGFRDIIYREAGIKLTDLKKALVQARLTRRMRALGMAGFDEYYSFLMDHYEEEKIHFINAITTNKTDFFREDRHFEFLKQHVFPAWEREGKKEIRAWSAGCSTGEEPYSLAITFLEYYGANLPDIRILSTDIDTVVLEKAEKGIYEVERVASIPRPVLKKYFEKGVGPNAGFFRVKQDVRNLVHVRRLNLLDSRYPMKKGFDIIFCRNVIIYFDKETQKTLFARFSGHLKNDGFLFIGHSENITSFSTDFVLVGNTIYRKA